MNIDEFVAKYDSEDDDDFDPTKDNDRKAAEALGFVEGKNKKKSKKRKRDRANEGDAWKKIIPPCKLTKEEIDIAFLKWNEGKEPKHIPWNPPNTRKKRKPWWEVTPEERLAEASKVAVPGISEPIEMIEVVEKKQFAGKIVEVVKVVDKKSKEAQKFMENQLRRSNVDYVLEILLQKKDLTAVDKSRIDWERDKKETGDTDELRAHVKSKDAFIGRTRFLNRAVQKEFLISKLSSKRSFV